MKNLKKAFIGGLCGLIMSASAAYAQDKFEYPEDNQKIDINDLNNPKTQEFLDLCGEINRCSEAVMERIKKEREVRWALHLDYFQYEASGKKEKAALTNDYLCEPIDGENGEWYRADGMRYEFYTPKNSSQRIYERIEDNLSEYDGLAFSIKGDGKVYLQVVIHDENCGCFKEIDSSGKTESFGDVYELAVDVKPYWTQHQINFRTLKIEYSPYIRLDKERLKHVCSVGFRFPHARKSLFKKTRYVEIKDFAICRELPEKLEFFNMSGKK